jgi:hypothetical protein
MIQIGTEKKKKKGKMIFIGNKRLGWKRFRRQRKGGKEPEISEDKENGIMIKKRG